MNAIEQHDTIGATPENSGTASLRRRLERKLSPGRISAWVAALSMGFLVVASALSVHDASSTWDEPVHLAGGLLQLLTGNPRLQVDHPPVARLLAAAPALLRVPPSFVASMPTTSYPVNFAVFGVINDQLLGPARLAMLTMALVIGWLLYAWAARLYGPERAWLPVCLFAFSPVFLANAPIVATDIGATAFMLAAVYALWRYLQAPSWLRLAWVGLATAVALATKFTALLLVPIFLILGAATAVARDVVPGSPARRALVVGGGLLVAGAIAIIGIDATYFFRGIGLTPPEYVPYARAIDPGLVPSAERVGDLWPSWLPIPLPFTYVVGVVALFGNVSSVGGGDFLGEFGVAGWPNYFVLSLLVKLTIPALVLIALGAFRASAQLPRDWWNVLFLVLPAVLLIAIASTSRLQIGVRHVLPALPFLFLLAGYPVRTHLRRLETLFAGTMVACSAWSCLAIHPHYLMYFNFLGGGPERGWRIVADGNDWGQGDADLGRWLAARNITSVALVPNGWGAWILNRANIGTRPPPCEDTGELVAAHVRGLVTPATVDLARCYAWMRARQPDEKIGYSIFLYNTKNASKLPNNGNAKPAPPANLELFNMASSLQRNGQTQAAISLYRVYLRQEPDYHQAHYNLGMALADTRQCGLAIPEFLRALELWPGDRAADGKLAACYREIGRPDLAQPHEARSASTD